MRGHRTGAAAILVAVVAGGAATAQEQRSAVARMSLITVEGEASRDVVPDMAVITLGVTTDRGSAREASNQTAKVAQALVAEMKASGVADRDIATAQATLTPVYDSAPTPRIKAFRAANVVQVKVHKLDEAGDLAGRLVDKGANDLQGVDFMVANPEPILDELRGAATRDARRRAEIYAGAAGVKLGRIVEIQPEALGQPQPFPRRMKMEMAVPPAAAPLEAGSQTLQARVTVTWELEQPAP